MSSAAIAAGIRAASPTNCEAVQSFDRLSYRVHALAGEADRGRVMGLAKLSEESLEAVPASADAKAVTIVAAFDPD